MTQGRLHYAWIVLIAAFIALAAGSGIRMSFGSFVRPWEVDFGVSRIAVSAVATVSFVVYALIQPLAGRLADLRGAGTVLGASLLTVAAGLLASYYATGIGALVVTYGLVASMGFGAASSVTASAAVARWFQSRRGLALAVLALALPAGQMTVTPAAIYLNDAIGWRLTLLYYSLGLIVLAPLAFWLVKPRPAGIGLLPYGATPTGAAAAPGSAAMPAAAHTRGETPGGAAAPQRLRLLTALRTPDFWYLALPYAVCGFTTGGLIGTHLIPFAADMNLPQASTAAAVSLLGVFDYIGTLTTGYLTDRVARNRLLAALYGIRGISLLFLMTVSSPGQLLVFVAIFGLVDFATVPPTTSLAADLFGSHNVGLMYGLIALSHQMGSAAGAFMGGWLHDATGNYTWAFLVAATTLIGAILLSLQVREPRIRTVAQPAALAK